MGMLDVALPGRASDRADGLSLHRRTLHPPPGEWLSLFHCSHILDSSSTYLPFDETNFWIIPDNGGPQKNRKIKGGPITNFFHENFSVC